MIKPHVRKPFNKDKLYYIRRLEMRFQPGDESIKFNSSVKYYFRPFVSAARDRPCNTVLYHTPDELILMLIISNGIKYILYRI